MHEQCTVASGREELGLLGLDFVLTAKIQWQNGHQRHSIPQNWFAILIVHSNRDLLNLNLQASCLMVTLTLGKGVRERLRPQGRLRLPRPKPQRQAEATKAKVARMG